jgi:hypothetical protein
MIWPSSAANCSDGGMFVTRRELAKTAGIVIPKSQCDAPDKTGPAQSRS